MSKKDKIEQEEIINEQETVQVEENQEVEIEAVEEEPTPEELNSSMQMTSFYACLPSLKTIKRELLKNE